MSVFDTTLLWYYHHQSPYHIIISSLSPLLIITTIAKIPPSSSYRYVNIVLLLLLLIKSDVSTCPIIATFSVVMCLMLLLYNHIVRVVSYISWESWVFGSITTVRSVMSSNNLIHYDSKVVFICLHNSLSRYHHYTDLPEGIKMIVRFIPTNACLRSSQWSFIQCMLWLERINYFSIPI